MQPPQRVVSARNGIPMALYYNLAHGTKRLAYAADYSWPFDIDICFDPVPHPIAFSEGVGHASAGCTVSASESLEPKWKEHFDITHGHWLIPYIEKMIQGLPLPKEEMITRFKELHGKLPECYPSRFS
ncbi:hypothetical protein [Burkholderia ubonensis]|nr:hypothetical protein [Burkholderia ubonensis]